MKILIADDHDLFLKGLELILGDVYPDADFVFAQSYTDIFSIIEHQKDFNLVLTDLAMPGSNWLEAIEKIHKALPEVPIIILSAVFDKEIIAKTINIGASGYIPKTSSNQIILDAVNLVLSGGVHIPTELLTDSLSGELDALIRSAVSPVLSGDKTLTPRQIDVLKLIEVGKSNKVIAYDLGLTEGTVKLHVTAILKVLGVFNRTGAVAEAKKYGILK